MSKPLTGAQKRKAKHTLAVAHTTEAVTKETNEAIEVPVELRDDPHSKHFELTLDFVTCRALYKETGQADADYALNDQQCVATLNSFMCYVDTSLAQLVQDRIDKQLQQVSAREDELMKNATLNALEAAERQLDLKRERERILRDSREELHQAHRKAAASQLQQYVLDYPYVNNLAYFTFVISMHLYLYTKMDDNWYETHVPKNVREGVKAQESVFSAERIVNCRITQIKLVCNASTVPTLQDSSVGIFIVHKDDMLADGITPKPGVEPVRHVYQAVWYRHLMQLLDQSNGRDNVLKGIEHLVNTHPQYYAQRASNDDSHNLC